MKVYALYEIYGTFPESIETIVDLYMCPGDAYDEQLASEARSAELGDEHTTYDVREMAVK
jgi:hypothetical protein